MAVFGYMGKLLRVDLSRGQITEEPLDLRTARDYIGGVGYATRLIYDELSPSTDPLGPENRLVFMTGPVTGTRYPTSARYQLCTKSPLTGIWVEASSSGYWGAELKRSGYDGIIIQGASAYPVYLVVRDGSAELRDASALWGQDTFQVQRSIRGTLGDSRFRIACIGPAGERQVLPPSGLNDVGRAAGRGGVGAVMGSKKLKAIAVRGTQRVAVAEPARFREKVREVSTSLSGPTREALSLWGTAAAMDTGWLTGDVPVKNWRQGLWKEGCLKLGGKRMAETILKKHHACQGCPIRCARWVKLQGRFRMEGPGPEYQTLASFGPLVLNDNLEVVCAANDLCNRYGLDTVSTGSAIAFAMEAYERGILSREEADGLDLSWGNAEAILELTRQIGEGAGLGRLLGQGVKRASQALGRGSESFAVHVKGMEVPMHDPRAFFSMAVNYATGARGADHMRGNAMAYETGLMPAEDEALRQAEGSAGRRKRFDDQGKGRAAKLAQDRAAVINSMIICMFAGQDMSIRELADTLKIVTGFPYTRDEVLRAGERIVNLQRAYNLRCGLSEQEDRLPPRLLEPTDEGGHAGRVPDLSLQLREYYEARGWTAEGRPRPEKLRELGLEEVTRNLEGLNL